MVVPDAPASRTPPSVPPVQPPHPIPPSATNEGSSEWPVQATDTIVNLVDQVRDKTTGPVLTAARGAVFGLLAAFLTLMVAVLLLIGAIRLLDNALPGGVWLAYLVVGVVFVVAGGVVFSRRNHVVPTTTP